MKKYLKTVTVTGASDDTSIEEMAEIQKEFPFVEWGILLSKRQAGKSNRFPSRDWLYKLEKCRLTEGGASLKLSGHLCGEYVNEILQKNWLHGLTFVEYLEPEWFDRIQINTHGEKHKVDLDVLIQNIGYNQNIQFIAQYDKVNNYIHELDLMGISNISALYDLSHGAGVLPSEWDLPLDGVYTGYAGGLSVENLESQLQKLDEIIEVPIWIDAETWLRTEDKFDLQKVRQFLTIAQSRVI
jgi:hypothetical protein